MRNQGRDWQRPAPFEFSNTSTVGACITTSSNCGKLHEVVGVVVTIIDMLAALWMLCEMRRELRADVLWGEVRHEARGMRGASSHAILHAKDAVRKFGEHVDPTESTVGTEDCRAKTEKE